MYGFPLKRVDTDMTSMEEITKYDAEKANPVAVGSDIGLIYGPIAEETGVVPPTCRRARKRCQRA
jgi:putative spermidine/putrescine transport system substrate-binding protein